MSILREIRRRKIFQVAAVYAVTAWLLVQIITAVEEPLRLPDWFATVVILLLFIGFPITLVMSWAYNLTPDGVVRDTGASQAALSGGRFIETALISLLIVAVGWIVFRESSLLGVDADTPLPTSIAVLPFENLSPDPNNDYMAAGVHEEVIRHLADIRGLSVRPRTAVLRYADDRPPVDQIASELGVARLLDGSVRYAADEVRISVDLIDAASGDVLWGNTYEEELSDIFAIESNIAANVAGRMQVEFSLQDQQRISTAPTQSAEAYALYLRGRYFWNQRTEEAIERALEYFNEAIALDDNYALAYAGLADIWIFRGWYSVLAPRETFPNAKLAVAEALRRDPNLAEAYASRAHIEFEFDHDGNAAEADYLRAIALDPRYPTAHHWYGGYLSAMGRHEEAMSQALAARELDFYSPIINTWVGLRHYFAGRPEQAIAEIEQALDLFPEFAPGWWHLSWAYEQAGRFDQAIEAAARAFELTGNPTYLTSLGHAYAMDGNEQEARDILSRLTEIARERHVSAYHVATIYVALGDLDASFRWLDDALEERSPWIGYMRVDPRLDPLRPDPRLERLIRRALSDF